jgi:hypothetical protein
MAAQEKPAQARLLAMIVGVDRYEHLHSLQGPSRDARLVFDALRRTRMTATAVVSELMVTDGGCEPTRQAVLAGLQRLAAQASARDTLLIFFAGHGLLAGHDVALVPCDGHPLRPQSLVSIREMREVFAGIECARRALLVDACQENVPMETEDGPLSAPPAHAAPETSARGYRTRGGVASGFCESLNLLGPGWTILTSCSPGQLSLEAQDLDGHGVFSYYVALGLRGDADLDGDGTVGLGELAQYVSNKVPREARMASGGFLEQVPQLICQGPIAPWTDNGALTGDALTPEWREFRLPAGLGRLWRGHLRGEWPFEPLTAWRWLVRGTAVLYGLCLGVLMFQVGFAARGPIWVPALLAGAAGAALWLGLISFATASTLKRFHHAGYLAGSAVVGLHAAVLAGGLAWSGGPATQGIVFGMMLFLLLCVMIVFGCNAAFTIISLLDLERRGEEGSLRDFFKSMQTKLIRADLPNPIACETFHPGIYLGVWLLLSAGLIFHMVTRCLQPKLDLADGLTLLRDGLLWVLVSWMASGYHTCYRHIFRKHPKRPRA